MSSLDEFHCTKRRAFLHSGALFLLGAGLGSAGASSALAENAKRLVRVGLVTDLHYADKPAAGSRHYRETLAKLEEAAVEFEASRVDHVIELGDFIDAADSVEAEMAHLRKVNKQFAALPGRKHYVLGQPLCSHVDQARVP